MKTAKTIKAITTVVLIFTVNFIFSLTGIEKSGHSKDTSLCLIVKGKVTKTTESAGHSYTVQLVDNDNVIQQKIVKAGAKFQFQLKKNKWYAVKINKGGCMSKFISITTHNLPEVTEDDMYVVNFDLADPVSYSEAKYLDADAVDFPLAIIGYNRSIDSFDYNEEYTKNIKNKLVSNLDTELVVSEK